MGAKIPKGILLYGKPGTGKTLIAKAIAGEAGVPFISMSGSEFIEMFAGLGASRVRKLFEKAKKIAPCIVFIDEIDAIGSRRTNASGAESENNQTLNQLLVEMDGFDTNQTVIVLAATNRPEMLDKALLRPGRFDRQITISTPDAKGREEILKIHAKNKKFANDIKLKDIANDTAGFTGAELANVLNEAAIIATINKHKKINMSDLDEAVKKVTVGLEKHSRVISDKDKKLTAYHEAGHAIVSRYLETSTDVKEISIIPRGVAGGYTMYKSDEDKFYISITESSNTSLTASVLSHNCPGLSLAAHFFSSYYSSTPGLTSASVLLSVPGTRIIHSKAALLSLFPEGMPCISYYQSPYPLPDGKQLQSGSNHHPRKQQTLPFGAAHSLGLLQIRPVGTQTPCCSLG